MRRVVDLVRGVLRRSFALSLFGAGAAFAQGSTRTVTGTVNNATNKAYNAEFVLGGFAQPAVPRSWVVDARYNF